MEKDFSDNVCSLDETVSFFQWTDNTFKIYNGLLLNMITIKEILII